MIIHLSDRDWIILIFVYVDVLLDIMITNDDFGVLSLNYHLYLPFLFRIWRRGVYIIFWFINVALAAEQ